MYIIHGIFQNSRLRSRIRVMIICGGGGVCNRVSSISRVLTKQCAIDPAAFCKEKMFSFILVTRDSMRFCMCNHMRREQPLCPGCSVTNRIWMEIVAKIEERRLFPTGLHPLNMLPREDLPLKKTIDSLNKTFATTNKKQQQRILSRA